MREEDKILDENEAKNLLEKYGIKRPEHVLLKHEMTENIDLQDIVERKFDYPLVAKIVGDEVTHKTDLEAIQMGINSYDELVATIEDFRYRFPRKNILIEEHVSHEVEFILGMKKHKTFGEVLMFGGGGIFTELYEDVVFRKPPLEESEIRNMIKSTKIGEITEGYRNLQVEKRPVKDAIQNLSDLVMDKKEDIHGIDINPLVVKADDPIALDASIGLG